MNYTHCGGMIVFSAVLCCRLSEAGALPRHTLSAYVNLQQAIMSGFCNCPEVLVSIICGYLQKHEDAKYICKLLFLENASQKRVEKYNKIGVDVWDYQPTLDKNTRREKNASHVINSLSCAISPQGLRIAFARLNSTSIKLLQVDRHSVTSLRLHERPIAALAFSIDGTYLIAADTRGELKAINLQAVPARVTTYSDSAFGGGYISLHCLADGRSIVMASSKRIMKCALQKDSWRFCPQSKKYWWGSKAKNDLLYRFDITSSGACAAAIMRDTQDYCIGRVWLFSRAATAGEMERKLLRFDQQPGLLNSLKLSEDGQRLAIVGLRGSLSTYELRKGESRLIGTCTWQWALNPLCFLSNRWVVGYATNMDTSVRTFIWDTEHITDELSALRDPTTCRKSQQYYGTLSKTDDERYIVAPGVGGSLLVHQRVEDFGYDIIPTKSKRCVIL